MYELTNGAITIHFEPVHGNIVRFSHDQKHIELVGEPGLAENFRILLPLPDFHGHYIYGKSQKLDSFLLEKDRATLTWKTLESEQGSFPVEVRMTVELAGDDAVFSININNQSEFVVEEVFTPALGGMANIEERDDWHFLYHSMFKSDEWKFYKEFPYKFLSNTWFNEYDSMPWCDLYNVKRRTGVYVGNHDLEPRYGMIMQQLHPNIAFDNRWPDPDEVDDGNTGYTFKDLPKIARDAKEYGINVIQIDGWNNGGIDRNYPDYSPDPKLGTTEELKAAIKECQDMGTHFLLFNNLQVASYETEMFKNELHKYVIKDYWGTPATLFGYGFHTALELNYHATNKMAYMDVSTGFRHVMTDQMKKMIGY